MKFPLVFSFILLNLAKLSKCQLGSVNSTLIVPAIVANPQLIKMYPYTLMDSYVKAVTITKQVLSTLDPFSICGIADERENDQRNGCWTSVADQMVTKMRQLNFLDQVHGYVIVGDVSYYAKLAHNGPEEGAIFTLGQIGFAVDGILTFDIQ